MSSMKLDRFLRLFIGLLIALIFIIAIGALLFITESALNVWDRLLEGPGVLLYGYVALMALLGIAAMWLMVRLLVRRKIPDRHKAGKKLSRSDIETRLQEAEATGVDVADAQAELRELASRRKAGSVHLCFFGEVSSGKSSLIKAMVPQADVIVDVVGGSTTDIRHYRWRDNEGTQILLTDVPGISGHDRTHDGEATQEALRSHLVVFVCDSDLTRAEAESVKALLGLDKPLVLVLNKSDRYSAEEQAVLMEHLLDRLQTLGSDESRGRVVAVSAGGKFDAVTRSADGGETTTRRTRPADIGVLVVAINRLLQGDLTDLDVRRDRAVFHIASEKLAAAESEYREQRAAQIIRTATRRAVIGAMAAVSPGTDIIIQGYIGTSMTQSLCKLYGAAPRDVDVEDFLSLSQSRAGKALPLTLAVAGNGLKAFPGIGTVAGGLVHAVAYGLIFDALGRSLVMTLGKHGKLKPEAAATEFEEGIGEHIEAGVRQVARMALEQNKDRNDN